ncbi:PREDICTED: probable glycosyltransferase At3g07620 [Tarenaya hassleriana]|uniref:probable glycosyltransferase At3g07620 n=1 Tax=Tarenaya hassleriana TaxID=28532 RepID=UPI00053CA8AA|nr:PREDICTED: probable glycosyltransferase At3g07620 [Tarenaya hassleriana]XP_010535969.1 PREDICTED: probable glycosyltransferase At3g07620 [Tarenaya hassleriana]XP_010535970.1 PREDICTED: probable glycosyltransferase At3g07620 [Tarenaya hassleriana]XP_010535972.1 PREDICTED: probable glycosyltransferase At3g07620 [Tarenaya hassleriana]XP_010535973.1 PREDICTED: probable glycosyltransferase At3g07620 [Tarenaya hassleriana]
MKMRNPFGRFCNVEIRRLLWIIIVTVSVLLVVVHCFGLPCCKSLSRQSPDNVSAIIVASDVAVSGDFGGTESSVSKIMNYTNISDVGEDDEYEEEEYNEGEKEKKRAFSLEAEADSGRINEGKKLNFSVNIGTNVSWGSSKGAIDSTVANSNKSLVVQSKVMSSVISISEMNSMLVRSLSSSHSQRPRWSSARHSELLSAKSQIENAPIVRDTPGLDPSVYRNISKFYRSYELMERKLRVYVYKEGEKPIFHKPKPRGIYASEGWFLKLMEGNKKFTVRDPRKAHLFYMPVSIRMLRMALGRDFQTPKELSDYLNKYVSLIAGKYKFWNRTGGADHFLVACHDWGNKLTKKPMKNTIRSLCNANIAQGFRIWKDTSLPVTYIRSAEAPLEYVGGKPRSERQILAFFAGSMHGYLRPILLRYWENKEPDMKIFGPMPRDPESKKQYREYMKGSRYCICARGYEVHTPRVVEAIAHECVPVIISDNYVPPFFEVLNWETFSVFVEEKDVPNLRNILLSIPEEKYLKMQARVKMVQKHFLWHKKPVKYDLFHLILHSIWYNRVYTIKPR